MPEWAVVTILRKKRKVKQKVKRDSWITEAAEPILRFAELSKGGSLDWDQLPRESEMTLKLVCDVLHKHGFIDADYYAECDWGDSKYY